MSEEQNINIKQRIIGALVLVSLGIILIPMLLNGGKTSNQSISGDNIPKMPKKFKTVLNNVPQPMVMPEPKTVKAYPERKKDNVTKTTENKTSTVPKSKNTIEKKKAPEKSKPKITAKPTSKPKVEQSRYEKATKPTSTKINKAYAIQIASFSEKSNAESLQSKLRKKKYKAYIESIMTSKGRIYRLRVGPYLKYDQIVIIKSKIEKGFKLKKTVIIKY